jgi:hypothetical protein
MENKTVGKPQGCTNEHLRYLDVLRESGATNMFGATSWLMNAYPKLTKDQANKILSYWMKTFSERHK